MFGEDFAGEIGRRYGSPVQMMQLHHGIFDEASISVIASIRFARSGRLAGRSTDVDDFVRMSSFVRCAGPLPGGSMVGRRAHFRRSGRCPRRHGHDARRSLRDGELRSRPGSPAPEVLKAVVRANQNNAGIYGTVTRVGRLAVGQTIVLPCGDRDKRTWVIARHVRMGCSIFN